MEVFQQQDLATLAVECSGLGIWQITATGAWHCSPRSKELLGIAQDDDPLTALSEKDRTRFNLAVATAVASGAYHLEFKVQQRWLSATGRVVGEGLGPVRIVGTLQDITAQKVALEERELRLAEVGHELMTPLAAVSLGIERLSSAGPKAPERLARMNAIVHMMGRIIRELLDLSESSLSIPEQSTVALAELCRAVIADTATVHPGRAIELNLDEDATGRWDAKRLRQVVRNLVQNALHYGRPDAPIEISLIDLADEAVLSVANRGPRIPDEVRAHLFEPFRRRASAVGGAGLGLYVVKRIVEAHGGCVTMSSDDLWTVFRVTLPKGTARSKQTTAQVRNETQSSNASK